MERRCSIKERMEKQRCFVVIRTDFIVEGFTKIEGPRAGKLA
jgi:hypothetical protein